MFYGMEEVARSFFSGGRCRRIAFESAGESAQRAGQVRSQRLFVRWISSVHDHHCQNVRALRKKVYQDPLIHPINLSQYPFDAVANDRAAGRLPHGKSDLQRHLYSHVDG